MALPPLTATSVATSVDPLTEPAADAPGPAGSGGWGLGTRRGARLALLAILVFSFALRTWNLDWDRGTHLQPDERFWSDVAANVENPQSWDLGVVLDPERSPLNPRVYKPNYVYGTLPLWASEAAAGVLMTDPMAPAVVLMDGVGINLVNDEPADAPVRDRLRFNTGYDVNLIGRLMAALVDTATVAAVYGLARELGAGRRVGLLAALLQSLTVLHIQYSHFLGSEPWVAFFVTVAVWGSVRLARGRGGWRTRVFTGIAIGCAVGSKLNGAAAAVAPVVATLVLIGPDLRELLRARIAPGVIGRTARHVEHLILLTLVAVVTYRIVQPYDFNAGVSLVLNEQFQEDLVYLQDINGGGNWPWVQPLVGATPLIHPLRQVFWWGMGPGLAIAAVFGMVRAVHRFRRGDRWYAVPVAVVLAYLALVSVQFYAIIRYLQPMYPTLVALAALSLGAVWNWARTAESNLWRTVARSVAIACIGGTVFWGLAFVNGVYGNDNARLAAGDWMIENLPAGSSISAQEWDDPLPWLTAHEFQHVTMRPFSFGGDTPEHVQGLIQSLDEVDYVVESSNKFYDALPLTPARFPQTSAYYDALFDGSLGFELVRTFNNRPSLFGISIDDSWAEEAFTLYDHPTVHIWRKTEDFSVQRAWQLLNPDRARTAVNAVPKDAGANASMLRPDDYATQQTGSSYRDVHSAGDNSTVAALSWFVAIQIAAWSMVPLVLAFGGRLAGAAFGLTKPAGMLALSVPLWTAVSYGVIDFSRLSAWLAMLAVLAFGAGTAWAFRSQVSAAWVRHRRLILIAEAVFVAVFLAVVALRAFNPDLWHPWRGGEKPMELAYFTAVTGSTTLPPYDPWLAGGSLNYYYFGWWVLAVPTRLLGLAPDIAFNLGVATYAALAAAAVFSTAAMLAGMLDRHTERRMPIARTGGLAVLVFLIIGNLDALRQVWRRLGEGQPLSDFDWWDPSRVIKDSPGFEVTEFPAFTVLFADLHPHFMTMGFFGLTIALSVAAAERLRQDRTRTAWALVLAAGVMTGIVRMVHTWDLPTVIVIAAGAVVVGNLMARGPAIWRAGRAFAQLIALAVMHLGVTAPYRSANQVADSGFGRSESVSKLDDWFVHWGLFLLAGAVYGAVRFRQLLDDADHSADPAAQAWRSSALGLAGAVGAVGLLGFAMTVGSVAGLAFGGLTAGVVLLVLELRSTRPSTGHVILSACWALGFGIMVGVEAFTQNADIARLNTVFKFWLQVWHLFAIAGAVGAVWVFVSQRESAPAPTPAMAAPEPSSFAVIARTVLAVGGGAMLAASLLYPVLSVRPRLANRFDTAHGPSLQGHLWLEPGATTVGILDKQGNEYEIDPGLDRSLIEWLRDNVDGRPTVVEAVGGSHYQWWGRVSIMTGLPAVVGWRWHQDQQRTLYNFEVNQRDNEVDAFYRSQTDAEIESFLRAYDVGYVIVGSLELAVADEVTLGLLATNPALEPVFTDGDRVIYEVGRAELARSGGPALAVGGS